MNADLRKMREMEDAKTAADVFVCLECQVFIVEHPFDICPRCKHVIMIDRFGNGDLDRPYLIDSDGVPPHTSGEQS